MEGFLQILLVKDLAKFTALIVSDFDGKFTR